MGGRPSSSRAPLIISLNIMLQLPLAAMVHLSLAVHSNQVCGG
jgi:hypothetical protein